MMSGSCPPTVCAARPANAPPVMFRNSRRVWALVARAARIVCAGARLSEPGIRPAVRVTSWLPPGEPCVSVRLSSTLLPDEEGNPQHYKKRDREHDCSPESHGSASCHGDWMQGTDLVKLTERVRCALLLNLFVHPLFELVRAHHGDKTAHLGVP